MDRSSDHPSGDPADVNDPTTALPRTEIDPGAQFHVRLFGSHAFFRLWIAQIVSAFGDWLGFFAIIVIAGRVGGETPGAAIALVMTARILPGFFLASAGGVIVDRLNRKRLLITCDLGRAGVLLLVPLIDTVWGLVLASLALEIFTSLWSPAKEAVVPNLVPADHLTTANSLSLVAAYGTFPVASAVFAFAAQVATWLGKIDALQFLEVDKVRVAIGIDAVSFVVSAALITTLPLVARPRSERSSDRRIDFAEGMRELREGWNFIFYSRRVRAVMVGLGTAMIGGGMLIPLGPVFNTDVLGAGESGFGLILTFLGIGVALGVLALSALQKRVNKDRTFSGSVLFAGAALIAIATLSDLFLALALVLVLGVCAGAVYVLGFTILHESVDDGLRGRVFSAMYTVVRFCLLISIAIGGALSDFLDWVFERTLDGAVSLGGLTISLPGVRGALWLAGLIILLAGLLAFRSLRPEKVENSQ